MRAAGQGSIINVTSIVASIGIGRLPPSNTTSRLHDRARPRPVSVNPCQPIRTQH
jgi:hypothetical protein